MPTHIRWFSWLSLTAVAYSAGSMLIFAFTTDFDAYFPLMSAAERAHIVHQTIVLTLATTAAWSGLSVLFIACTVLGRWNWGRWAYAGLFAFRHLMPFAAAAAYHMLDRKLHNYFQFDRWNSPLAYLPTILTLAAMAVVFTGDAKAWFVRPTPAPA